MSGTHASGGTSGGRFAALASPPYRLFWLGSLASIGGVQLVMMGQAWLVFELSGEAADLAVLGMAASLPTILITLGGGVVADRFDRRRIMLLTTPISAALLALLTILDATNLATVYQVWMIAALFAAIAGMDWPARQAIFTALINRDQMTSAIALNSVLWQGTRMIMPAIGGVIVAAFTTAAVFGLATFGFLLMWGMLARLRVEPNRAVSGSSWEAFTEGFAYVVKTPLFAVLIPLTYVTMFFGTSYLQIMPLFAERLGVGAEGFGVLLSASGIGSIFGTLLSGSLQNSKHRGAWMLAGALASAAMQLAFAAVTFWFADAPWAFGVSAILVVVVATLSSVYLITSLTALQLSVPDDLRGRVMSLHGITFSLIALGALFSGGLATYIGAPAAVAVGATVIIVSVLTVALRQPQIVNLHAA